MQLPNLRKQQGPLIHYCFLAAFLNTPSGSIQTFFFLPFTTGPNYKAIAHNVVLHVTEVSVGTLISGTFLSFAMMENKKVKWLNYRL